MLSSRQRRRFRKGIHSRYDRLIKKLTKSVKNVKLGEKPAPVKVEEAPVEKAPAEEKSTGLKVLGKIELDKKGNPVAPKAEKAPEPAPVAAAPEPEPKPEPVAEKPAPIKEEPKPVNGLLLGNEKSDVRYLKGKVISAGDKVTGIKEGDIIRYDKHAGFGIEWEDNFHVVITVKDVVIVE